MIWGRDRERLAELEDQLARQEGERIYQARVQAERVQAEQVREFRNDTLVNSRGYDLLQELLDMSPTASGVQVTPTTAKKCAVVYACARLIAEAMATLPACIYERLEDRRNFKEADFGVANGLWWLLNESPAPNITSASWMEWMILDALLQGDGITVIQRRGPLVQYLIPVPREHVVVDRNPRDRTRLLYSVSTEEGIKGFDQDDVIHLPGFGFNGLRGMSVIQYAAREAISILLSAERFAGKFFKQGLTASMVLEAPGNVKNPDELRHEWAVRYGGEDNSHLPIVLTHGMTAKPVTMKAEDAQLLQTRLFEVVDICRAFGVPPHMIGETAKVSAWGTGIEQLSQGFVRYTLHGWKTRMEQEQNRKFWPRSTKFFLRYKTTMLLRGDSTAEANYFRTALGGPNNPGWLTTEEVRGERGDPPTPQVGTLFTPEPGGTGGDEEDGPPAPGSPAGDPGEEDGDEEGGERAPAPAPGRGGRGRR